MAGKKPQKTLALGSTCSLRHRVKSGRQSLHVTCIHFAWKVVPVTEQNVTGSKRLPEGQERTVQMMRSEALTVLPLI